MTTVVITILALWFLLSALAQLKLGASKSLKNYDAFSLLPNWSFFAPRPGTVDYHLLFRDCVSSDECEKWQEIVLSDPRTPLAAVWNPGKRCKKALSDNVRVLVQFSKRGSIEGISLTVPYLATLNYITAIPRDRSITKTQFMILRSYGFHFNKSPDLILVSDLHAV